ncbi:AMP-dependent synthetase and ligase [Novosphingobium aromaticivorans DSM 12444]|jgi:fatty-acyl-CoA synthase|uniref:3-methylmercaptopropionyl-CoA ligase n=1 Tax=Novosphingobium aromaticivorans (strain ATCC 700278 / DSM 12444 / CCUG 56034 / CIP 105152 / NBRC 16084 / F199) TaxID=279238 RepID=Q2G7P0_NOVAD|nr:AMP-binding protein [Novosphingobium aromaticivorans]ABD26133.1 AMP-dependent synthetase and ligase [Novosphingobium aromaticivorans DSM 12444]SCY58736.1 fatty-acyl-CoA synthase [Novosphingobium aromaticivorans]
MTQLSYAKGPADEPLLEKTIGQALRDAAALWGDELALVSRHQQIRWTWAQLDAEVDRIATGLLDRGVAKGDRVGIWAPNCAEWTVLQFATARIGAILVTINPAYRTSEVEYALNKVGCTFLVTAARFKTSDYVAMLRELGPDKLPGVSCMVVLGADRHDGFEPWEALRAEPDAARLAAAEAALNQNDAINIQFTSGTTGFPKGATLTHRNILNNGHFTARTIKLTQRDRICIPVPLYHCFGMVLGNLAALASGAAMVYPGEAYDPQLALAAVAEEGCTALYGVPTMFITILAQPDLDRYDVSTLRTGIMAGSPCPVSTMRQVMDRLNMTEVTIGYGMTETSPLTTQTATDDPLEERVGTVGRVHPHAEAKIVGLDGETLPIGQQGEYCSRGYAVMLGYWDDPEKTAEAIDGEGWMHSGDLATMDEHGYVRITGRIKDMIIRGGENIYPREIEEFLLTHPAVQDAQVFGVSDEKFGEEVCAWVIARSGHALSHDDILAHCKGRIAHYKVPRHVRVVEAFAMTVTGKAQKFEMRKMMEAELTRTG